MSVVEMRSAVDIAPNTVTRMKNDQEVTMAVLDKDIMANKGEPVIYDFAAFMYVLDVGFWTDYFKALPFCDFNSVVTGIEFNY